MTNLTIEILDAVKEFVIDFIPTLEEVSKEYYTIQYGPCPYLNGVVTAYPVKAKESNTPYAEAKRFLDEVSLDNLVEIRVDVKRNSFEYPLEICLFILYRDLNSEVMTYSIPLRFLTTPLQLTIDQFKEDTERKQANLKEELEALIKEHKKQERIRNNPEYYEYLQLKAKYGKEKKDGNRTRQ